MCSPKRLRSFRTLENRLMECKAWMEHTALNKLAKLHIAPCKMQEQISICNLTVRECKVLMSQDYIKARWRMLTRIIMLWRKVRIYLLPDKRKPKDSSTSTCNCSDQKAKASVHTKKDSNPTTTFQRIYQITNLYPKLTFKRSCLVMT